ncbi:hypothetical protein GDO86_012956 [Hymenochirus boettgeri]|uniref:Uncharacterized protein n=1 Tax=Hymenochirus boettgeri TaxID=247094 RepID=A0A8T2IWL6_9PIPI|nr:hypothetical protein GDO86_012956 [Hymenochirus boettgeri]
MQNLAAVFQIQPALYLKDFQIVRSSAISMLLTHGLLLRNFQLERTDINKFYQVLFHTKKPSLAFLCSEINELQLLKVQIHL